MISSPRKSRAADFNPRSPQGGATLQHRYAILRRAISIHAPRKGERRSSARPSKSAALFQSTLPARGSDSSLPRRSFVFRYFNPRSPQGGATCAMPPSDAGHSYFNPRSPQGGATIIELQSEGKSSDFNPRSPQGGATAEKCICMQHFREFAEYYPLRHGDARCIAPQDCIIQAFFGAKKRCFYVRLCFALKNKGVRG